MHPGLIVVPADRGRAVQQQLTAAVIAWIRERASETRVEASDFVVSKLVEIDEQGVRSAEDLPASG